MGHGISSSDRWLASTLGPRRDDGGWVQVNPRHSSSLARHEAMSAEQRPSLEGGWTVYVPLSSSSLSLPEIRHAAPITPSMSNDGQLNPDVSHG
jgi:hypothetical protein